MHRTVQSLNLEASKIEHAVAFNTLPLIVPVLWVTSTKQQNSNSQENQISTITCGRTVCSHRFVERNSCKHVVPESINLSIYYSELSSNGESTEPVLCWNALSVASTSINRSVWPISNVMCNAWMRSVLVWHFAIFTFYTIQHFCAANHHTLTVRALRVIAKWKSIFFCLKNRDDCCGAKIFMSEFRISQRLQPHAVTKNRSASTYSIGCTIEDRV